MRAEFVEAISDLANAARERKWQAVPNEPRGRLWRENIDGKVEYLSLNPSLVTHTFSTVESYRDFARSLTIENTAIFVSEKEVVILYDEGVSDGSRATLPLKFTDPFEMLMNIGKKKYSQADFIKLLRVSLVDTLQDHANILQAIRNLKWTDTAVTGGNITHGNEQMSKALQREVTGAGAIPETVKISVDVFNQFSNAKTIRCALMLEMENKQIMLEPLAGDVERAKKEALEEIRQLMILDGGPPVYLGTP